MTKPSERIEEIHDNRQSYFDRIDAIIEYLDEEAEKKGNEPDKTATIENEEIKKQAIKEFAEKINKYKEKVTIGNNTWTAEAISCHWIRQSLKEYGIEI